MIFCTVIGVTIERIAYRPLRNSTRLAALITAIGVSLFLQYATMYVVGPDSRAYLANSLLANVPLVRGQIASTSGVDGGALCVRS